LIEILSLCIYTDLTHIAASSTLTDDVTNYGGSIKASAGSGAVPWGGPVTNP